MIFVRLASAFCTTWHRFVIYLFSCAAVVTCCATAITPPAHAQSRSELGALVDKIFAAKDSGDLQRAAQLSRYYVAGLEIAYGRSTKETGYGYLGATRIFRAAGWRSDAFNAIMNTLRVATEQNLFQTELFADALFEAASLMAGIKPEEIGIGLFKTALKQKLLFADPSDVEVRRIRQGLAFAISAVGRHREALSIIDDALSIEQKKSRTESVQTRMLLAQKVLLLERMGDNAAAAELGQKLERHLHVEPPRSDNQHSFMVSLLSAMASLEQKAGNYSKAIKLLKKNVTLFRVPGKIQNKEYIVTLSHILSVQRLAGDFQGATATIKEIVSVLEPTAAVDSSYQVGSINHLGAAHYGALELGVDTAWEFQARSGSSIADAFSLAQMSRFSKADIGLTKSLTVKRRELARSADDIERRYALALASKNEVAQIFRTFAQQDYADRRVEILERFRSRSELQAELINVEDRIKSLSPSFFDLGSVSRASISQVQGALKKDEAYLYILAGREKSMAQRTFVFLITKDTSRWHKLDMTAGDLQTVVDTLRCGLDPGAWSGANGEKCIRLTGLPWTSESAKPMPFNLQLAHRMKRELVARFHAEISGIRHLIVTATGPLASLPIHVLPTTAQDSEYATDFESFGKVEWLGEKFAFNYFPSPANFVQVRNQGTADRRSNSIYLGVGAPVLDGSSGCSASSGLETCLNQADAGATTLKNSYTRAAGSTSWGAFPGSLGVDRSTRDAKAVAQRVRQLCPLPEAAVEIDCVANRGFKQSRKLIGVEASERTLKDLSRRGQLKPYSVVHFATHGLISLESSQLGLASSEPALVLTPPVTSENDVDDGLLTVSEIERLDLDADWVVLSACNTASAASLDFEAFSGLGQAFLFAGARSILVSHWVVDSYSSVKIVSGTLGSWAGGISIRKSEALQQSIREFKSTSKWVEHLHPYYWAPFVVVGE